MNYTFQRQALEDIAKVLDQVETTQGAASSDELELRFWRSFALLGESPGLGHRRQDLTERDLYFSVESPYYVVYRKHTTHIVIHAVLHASRDIRSVLQHR